MLISGNFPRPGLRPVFVLKPMREPPFPLLPLWILPALSTTRPLLDPIICRETKGMEKTNLHHFEANKK